MVAADVIKKYNEGQELFGRRSVGTLIDAYEQQEALLAEAREALEAADNVFDDVYTTKDENKFWGVWKKVSDALAKLGQPEPEPDICPICHSDIGHRVNCPNGIAFTRQP